MDQRSGDPCAAIRAWADELDALDFNRPDMSSVRVLAAKMRMNANAFERPRASEGPRLATPEIEQRRRAARSATTEEKHQAWSLICCAARGLSRPSSADLDAAMDLIVPNLFPEEEPS